MKGCENPLPIGQSAQVFSSGVAVLSRSMAEKGTAGCQATAGS